MSLFNWASVSSQNQQLLQQQNSCSRHDRRLFDCRLFDCRCRSSSGGGRMPTTTTATATFDCRLFSRCHFYISFCLHAHQRATDSPVFPLTWICCTAIKTSRQRSTHTQQYWNRQYYLDEAEALDYLETSQQSYARSRSLKFYNLSVILQFGRNYKYKSVIH